MTETRRDFHELVYSHQTNLTKLAQAAGLKNIVMLSHWQIGDVRYPRFQSVRRVAIALKETPDAVYAAIEESYYRKHPEARPPDPNPLPYVA